ncbi:MAG: T6SS immunity protein Tli4 family protein, partial [Proteobacteria bacterium]|nr:T6SS immunity protein Tli4 family protein [Pseudomonadota bacterium]
VYPGEGPKIKAEIKAKVDKITSIKHTEEPSMLIGVFDSINPDSKIVVGYYNSMSSSRAQLYSYIRLDRVAFVQSIPSVAMVVDDKNARGGIRVDKTLYKKYVEELLDVARRLRLRGENEIPDESGVCIEEGFIASPLDFRSERIAIGFRFPEFPDVTFAVETVSTDRPSKEDSLEAMLEGGREGAAEMGLSALYSRIKFLRKADRAIGKWEGAEALARVPGKDGSPETHDFTFKTPGAAKDMLRPYVRIDLYTGVKVNTRGAVPPSLTDEEAVAMWDKLTSTIRVRPMKETPPGGKGKPESSPPAPKPGA